MIFLLVFFFVLLIHLIEVSFVGNIYMHICTYIYREREREREGERERERSMLQPREFFANSPRFKVGFC